jgi:hypothetical protein
MKSIQDSTTQLSAAAVDRFLQLSGWTRNYSFKNKGLMVYTDSKNMNIAIPASEKYVDFYYSIEQVLPTISEALNKNVDELLKEILAVYYDRVEFRIASESSKYGKIPLLYANDFITGIKELILYSACAEQKAQPICFRPGNMAKEVVNRFNMAQTSVGSFIFNIDIKVVEEQNEQMILPDVEPLLPIEHKIIERIVTALNQVESVVNNENLVTRVAEDAYETGITANMCDALMKMRPTDSNAEIEATIRYASAISQEPEKEIKKIVGPNHFMVIEELSKIYRDKKLIDDVVLTGFVQTVQKKSGDDIGEETIRLFTNHEGQNRIVKMELADDDFRLACDAIKEENEIEVAGELDMSSRIWVLNSIKSFRMKK